ncbi:MAG TPA: hypothetical protein VM094_05240, partial [Gemmatimonadales bacterium]|nr:hypothetical protein [Gemmatimonadales bacterium]
LDYVRYFSRDPRFLTLFNRYSYLTDVGEYRVYKRLGAKERRRTPPDDLPFQSDPPIAAIRPGLYVAPVGLEDLLQASAFLALVAILIVRLPNSDSRSERLFNDRT